MVSKRVYPCVDCSTLVYQRGKRCTPCAVAYRVEHPTETELQRRQQWRLEAERFFHHAGERRRRWANE